MAMCTCADPEAIVRKLDEQNKLLTAFHETFYGKKMEDDPPGGLQHGKAVPDMSVPGVSSYVGNDAASSVEGGDPGGKEKLGLAPIRFSNWAAPEVSNDGENKWSWIWQIAGIALALYNTKKQGDIADKQQRLSNDYYNMAKYKLDRFMKGTDGHTSYKDFELSLLDEVKTEPVAKMDCKDDRKRAKASTNSAYSTLGNYLEQQGKKLRVCIDDSKSFRMDYHKARMLVDMENYNLIDDQMYTDYKNDRRWNRRSEVLSLGRNMTGEALSYGDVARTLYNQLGPQFDKITGSIAGAIGYFGGRNDTYYPNLFLGNYGGLNINNLASANTSAGQWQPQALSAGV